ncbi:hypothetical protein V8C37DRAFT_383724 [Trichoderma ceciliae]
MGSTRVRNTEYWYSYTGNPQLSPGWLGYRFLYKVLFCPPSPTLQRSICSRLCSDSVAVSLHCFSGKRSSPLISDQTDAMLLPSLVAVFGLRLAAQVIASPVLLHDRSSVGKREVPATHALHERHTARMAEHWTKRDRLPAKTVLPMRIGLKQSNLRAGHDRLVEMLVIFSWRRA